MSQNINLDEIKRLIADSKKCVSDYFKLLISDTSNYDLLKKAKLLSYWLKTYVKFLKKEKSFNSLELVRYKRGDILSVDFGFRIGNELGGKHFAIVLDNRNNKASNVITVIPLTSLKDNYKETPYNHLLFTGIYELYDKKLKSLIRECKNEAQELQSKISSNKYEDHILSKKINTLLNKVKALENMGKELSNLKTGSIANIGQIVTISKMRIINPKKTADTLSKITVSEKDMNIIDEKIRALFCRQEKPTNSIFVDAFIQGLKK